MTMTIPELINLATMKDEDECECFGRCNCVGPHLLTADGTILEPWMAKEYLDQVADSLAQKGYGKH